MILMIMVKVNMTTENNGDRQYNHQDLKYCIDDDDSSLVRLTHIWRIMPSYHAFELISDTFEVLKELFDFDSDSD